MVNGPAWPDPVVVVPPSLATRPNGAGANLPVLYLLHGIKDQPSDWWSAKGQLAGILAAVPAHPMVIVMVSNGTPGRAEPPFAVFKQHFDAVRAAVNQAYQPDPARQGLLGISMGAKQALSIALGTPGFSVLGLLSGMFQGNHLSNVHGGPASWPANFGQSLQLYFHYCGRGADMPQGSKSPLGNTGDAGMFANNEVVCNRLTGTKLRIRDEGMHSWYFWRPEIAEFFRALNQVW